MSPTIIFVRHGQSTANVESIFANRPGIPGDLTPVGIAQAEALAVSLEGHGLTHIYSSPLPRAVQTADIIAQVFGLPLITDDALREYDVGEDEGFRYTGEGAWRWERYEAVQRAWLDDDRAARHPGGESLTDIKDRLLRFMATLVARHREDEVVLAVGHGGVFHMGLPAIFDNLPSDLAFAHPLDHTDRVVGLHDEGQWRCTHWAGLAFAPPVY